MSLATDIGHKVSGLLRRAIKATDVWWACLIHATPLIMAITLRSRN